MVGQLFAEQVYRHGFVHGDPHPGNVKVRKSEKGKLGSVLSIEF